MAWSPVANIKGPKGDTGATGSQGPQGATGSQGPQGVKGDQGATGSQGPAGSPGEKWFTASGAPGSVVGAIVGDWYLNTATGDYYEMTSVGTWTLRGNLKGPQGIQGPIGNTGPAGADGTPGEQWFTGAGVPSGTLTGSNVGDWYLRTDTGDYYEKTGTTTWTLRGNLKGPTGAQGTQGIQGPQGNTGPQGPAGTIDPSVDAQFTASQTFKVTDGNTGVASVITISHNTTGTPFANTGPAILFQAEDSTNTDQSQAQISSGWADVVHATRTGFLELRAVFQGVLQSIGTGLKLWGSRGLTLNRNVDPGTGNVDITGVYKTNGTQISYSDLLQALTAFANLSTSPQTPTGTTSTAGVMMGLGRSPGLSVITPKLSGKVLVTIAGYVNNNTAGGGALGFLYYGTGTAPANGGAVVGTNIGSSFSRSGPYGVNQSAPFAIVALITGLTLNTQIWIDLALAAVGVSTASLAGVCVTAVEIP